MHCLKFFFEVFKLKCWGSTFEILNKAKALHLSLELENSILIQKLIHLIAWIYERFDKKNFTAIQNCQLINLFSWKRYLSQIYKINRVSLYYSTRCSSESFGWLNPITNVSMSINVVFCLFLKSELSIHNVEFLVICILHFDGHESKSRDEVTNRRFERKWNELENRKQTAK